MFRRFSRRAILKMAIGSLLGYVALSGHLNCSRLGSTVHASVNSTADQDSVGTEQCEGGAEIENPQINQTLDEKPKRASEARPPLAVAPYDSDQAAAHQKSWANYLKMDVEITNSIGMKLLLIPASEFQMGSDQSNVKDEAPMHLIRLTDAYYLGRTEVTQAEWKSVMGTTPWKEGGHAKEGDDFPATSITHTEAEEFCRKLSTKEGKVYRLPTEAEWENACRAGTTTSYYFGDKEFQLVDHAWFNLKADPAKEEYAHRVGLKLPNPFGLIDMHGNVWEWCRDWYDLKYYSKSPKENPQGPSRGSFRVDRGGSWRGLSASCRSATRDGHSTPSRYDELGFRLAREL